MSEQAKTSQCKEREKLDAFMDGELPAAEAETFRDHLATCDACAKALHDLMMLEALPAPVAEKAEKTPPTNVRSLESARKKRNPGLLTVAVLVPLAAAAAWMIHVSGDDDGKGTGDGPVAMNAPLEVASARSLEARVAYGAADKYRPYDVARAAGPRAREDVPLATLANLEAHGDLHGVAAGLLLAGEDDRALQYLDRADASLDVRADHAALLVTQKRAADALAVLDRVLAENPKHPQALFNRALALRDLGLSLAAAEAFDAVAALGEAGWADEAKARAASLRGEHDARRDAWDAAKKAGLAMVDGGPPPPEAMVRATPEIARHYLYHAVRAAPSKERVLALAPLATSLDGVAGGHVLADWLQKSAARDFTKRAPLAATYAKLVASAGALDAAGAKAYLGALRAAGESDLLFGAMALVGASEMVVLEYERLAIASGDPWSMAMAARAKGASESDRGDYARAEETLRRAAAACASARVEWRCAGVEFELSGLLAREGRTSDARAVALRGLARSRASVYEMEARFVFRLGDLARLELSLSQVRAYIREAQLATPGDCSMQRVTQELLAAADVLALDPDRAIEDLSERSRCDQPITLVAADTLADVVRMGRQPAEAKTLVADLDRLMPSLAPDDRAYAKAIQGRVQPDGDALLRAALADAAKLPDSNETARKAEALAELTLATNAAIGGRADDALAAIAAGSRARDGADKRACTVGVAVDVDRILTITRDARGAAAVEIGKRAGLDLDTSAIVSPAARARLDGCAEGVRVLAMSPVHGAPDLLPAGVAWSYASSSGAPSAPSAPGRRVVVSDVTPPASLGLARLADWTQPSAGAVRVQGEAATPSRVLAEIADASEVEIHAHGYVDAAQSAASLLVLSPDADGRYALSAADIRGAHLRGRPVVVLGACHAAKTARFFHEAWSLPTSFVQAGARAVLASPSEIRDAEAGPFFDAVLARIRAGAQPSVALRDERATWLGRDPKSWVKDVIAFE